MQLYRKRELDKHIFRGNFNLVAKIFLERAKYFAKISYHLKIENSVNMIRKMANLELNIFN